MNVLPRHYINAIDRQIAEERETEQLNRKAGIRSTGAITGLEMAKTIIAKTYRSKQGISSLFRV